jgi:hypothetical protein
MTALTGGQTLIFAIVALVATVLFVVLPACRPYSNNRSSDSNRRLMREVERHADPQDR